MALEVIKPPLQPASHGAGGSYGNGALSVPMGSTFSAENCHPNMGKETITPGKGTPKKSPVRSKTATLSENGHETGRSPVRRRLDCEDYATTPGKSPAKAALLKEHASSPNKHFCRSPRCAANNPDYAVPAPRQYLKSKRHLLAGWQPPVNSKLKTPGSVRGDDAHHGCCTHIHMGSDGKHMEDQSEGRCQAVEQYECCGRNGACEHDGESAHASAVIDYTQHLDSMCSAQAVPQAAPQDVNSAVGLVLEDMDKVILSSETTSNGMSIGEEVPMNTKNPVFSALRADPVRASVRTDSDFSMRSITEEGSDGRRETFGSSRPPRRRYFRKGARRLSSGTASHQSVTLNKQEGLKRKQAEEWMWDTAIKDAVHKLAPQIPAAGAVNVLVKAFESVKLTEEEIRRAKYKNMAVGRLAIGGVGGVSQMETMASIDKVQQWDESMASADLVDETSNNNGDVRQDAENGSLTPIRSQARIPQYSSKSEPPKVVKSRWPPASNESMNGTKDDTFSERGASSISGKSRTAEWTCAKSQAGHMLKTKLKRCTSLHPFRLRTEERGAVKEYLFLKRLNQMWEEEERLRIPLAQGLPWTTEEPAIPPKPLVKEQTRPDGFKLLTDVRAVERAEFDGYIAERNSQIEMQKQVEERQRLVAEEEEVRRLRREMVPRAQLMPYFDRPFMPRRSSKKLTVPKEPKFHLKQSKRPRCMASCNSIAA